MFNPIDFIEARRADAKVRSGAFATGGTSVIDVFAGDLPCPWCGEATSESDAACHGCGRKFG